RPEGDGLLDQDVFAGAEGGEGGGRVLLGGVADVDEVDVGVGEEVVEPLVRLDAGEVHDLSGPAEVAADAAPVAGEPLGVAAADGGDLGVAQLAGGQVVDHAHEADADDADADHGRISLFVSTLLISTDSTGPMILGRCPWI